jgi:hypothetical protein
MTNTPTDAWIILMSVDVGNCACSLLEIHVLFLLLLLFLLLIILLLPFIYSSVTLQLSCQDVYFLRLVIYVECRISNLYWVIVSTSFIIKCSNISWNISGWTCERRSLGVRLGRSSCPISALPGLHHRYSHQGVHTHSREICSGVQLDHDECKNTPIRAFRRKALN